jgi:predicted anti-sigma-YlaC factor YlaD
VHGRLLLAALLALGLAGCSLKRMAVNRLGDALAKGGAAFASDEDPELIKAAAPFSLKLMESLLAESPRHRGLLFAASSGFTQYTYAFVQQEADELEENDFAAAMQMRARARRLYLRARDYGLRGLEASHPGLAQALRRDPQAALRRAGPADVPQLYWTAVSWAGAVSITKDNAGLIADLPIVEALVDRALELDESFEQGALHTFLITYEMSRQNATGEPVERSRRHFEQALGLAKGRQASPYVALAEAVCLKEQNRAEFEARLNQALAIDADAYPELRLVNLVMQRRARWLLAHTKQLFVE